MKKLQGKNMVRRIGRSRRYETLPEGLEAMAALALLRKKVIKPVLAGVGKPKRGHPPKNSHPLVIR